MNPRERVLAVLQRKPVDRIPVDLWYAPEVGSALCQHFGVREELEMWRALGLDKIVWDFIEYEFPDRGRVQTLAGAEGERRTMWGTPLRQVRSSEAVYSEFAAAPLQGYESVESLDDYPWWPELDRFDYAGAAARAQRYSSEFAVIGPWVSLFEIYCQMRGLDQALIDLHDCPEYVDAVLDRIEDIQSEMMRRMFQLCAGHLDLVFVSDDIGGQQGLLISPAMWRRYLEPRLRRWCELIHDHGLRVFYHTDGAVRPLIGPLIECGIDILNPIQHVCPGMDRAELKREFGSRVVFHGGVDNQSVLPRGTPEDVRRETRLCLETLGTGRGGYVCCSCHTVQAGTPIENILAMVEAVKSW